MEARFFSSAILSLAAALSLGASFRTTNFIVSAPTPELAREIGQAAERLREELAIEWTGQAIPAWSSPCMLTAEVAPNLGAGGVTTFNFERGEVFGWQMKVQGSRERVLDSVLPHEVTHTIFATHFRRPLPRWADEGACTTVEHPSEKAKQQQMLIEFLKTGRGISFTQMFAMKDYPPDIMPLYSQGFSLARYLIEQGGKRKFMQFVGAGMNSGNWPHTVREHYGYDHLRALQDSWLDWVRAGSPQLAAPPGPVLVGQPNRSNGSQLPRPNPNLIQRSQSPDSQKVAASDGMVPVGRPRDIHTPVSFQTPARYPIEAPVNTASLPPARWQPAGTGRWDGSQLARQTDSNSR